MNANKGQAHQAHNNPLTEKVTNANYWAAISMLAQAMSSQLN